MTTWSVPMSAVHHGNPWVPMGVVMASSIMVGLDVMLVNIALPEIGAALDVTSGVEWVTMAYLLAVCVSQPAIGWFADRFGRRRVYLAVLGSFTAASALCALATSFPMLVTFRVMQGLGGGALMPLGVAIALDAFPPARRGRAMAAWGIATMVAPGFGPVVGGWLVSVSWHWLFLVNVPIGLVTLLVGWRILPRANQGARRPFDLLGLTLGGAGLSFVVLGVSQAGNGNWPLSVSLLCSVTGVVALVGFVRNELARDDPLIELKMFSIVAFRRAIAATMLVTVSHFARLVMLPLALTTVRGYSALHVGVLFVPAALAGAVGMQLGGWWADKYGPRTPIAIGCAGVCVAMLGLWRLSPTTPDRWVMTVLAIHGLTWSLTLAPGMVAGVGQLPRHHLVQGASARAVGLQITGALTVAVLTAVVEWWRDGSTAPSEIHDAYGWSFLLAAVAAAGGFALSLTLPAGREYAVGANGDVA